MTGRSRWWMRVTAGLAAIFVVGTVVLVMVLRDQSDSPLPVSAATPLMNKPVAIVPGIYLLGRTQPGAAYVVDTSGGLVLIDSGLEATAAGISDQMAELKLDTRQIKAILLTHGHADHSLGAAWLRRATGAKVYAGRADCQPLRDGGPREAFFSTFHMPQIKTHPTTVDVELDGDERFQIGEAKFTALATPGHTPGSVCYLMEFKSARVLFTGDVVQALGSGSEKLGTYSAYLPPLYRGDARDFLHSLKRLRELPVPDLVLPGHPRMDWQPSNPRPAVEQWQGMLDKGIQAMELLLSRRQADGANFLDGNPREILPHLYYLGDLSRIAVYCMKTPKGLILVNAPGGPRLIEFLAERFKRLGMGDEKPIAVWLTALGDDAASGLPVLIQKYDCKVVAPTGSLETVRQLSSAPSNVIADTDLERVASFPVRTIALAGRGSAESAYLLDWNNKRVLMTGRIPTITSAVAAEQIMRDVGGPGGDYRVFIKSLATLHEVSPDIWLPAIPIHGQSANLYDREWTELLEKNTLLFSR